MKSIHYDVGLKKLIQKYRTDLVTLDWMDSKVVGKFDWECDNSVKKAKLYELFKAHNPNGQPDLYQEITVNAIITSVPQSPVKCNEHSIGQSKGLCLNRTEAGTSKKRSDTCNYDQQVTSTVEGSSRLESNDRQGNRIWNSKRTSSFNQTRNNGTAKQPIPTIADNDLYQPISDESDESDEYRMSDDWDDSCLSGQEFQDDGYEEEIGPIDEQIAVGQVGKAFDDLKRQELAEWLFETFECVTSYGLPSRDHKRLPLKTMDRMYRDRFNDKCCSNRTLRKELGQLIEQIFPEVSVGRFGCGDARYYGYRHLDYQTSNENV